MRISTTVNNENFYRILYLYEFIDIYNELIQFDIYNSFLQVSKEVSKEDFYTSNLLRFEIYDDCNKWIHIARNQSNMIAQKPNRLTRMHSPLRSSDCRVVFRSKVEQSAAAPASPM